MKILGFLAMLFCASAQAAPFDYLFVFSSQAAAQADPVVGQFWVTSPDGSRWRSDICFPNILAYDTAKDVVNGDGSITHMPYDSNWLMICSLPARNAALEAESTTHLVFDRAVPGVSGLLYTWLPMASVTTLMLQPTPSGSQYPFGQH